MIKTLWGLICLSLFSILLTAMPTLAATDDNENRNQLFSIKLEPAEVELAVGEETHFTLNHSGIAANNLRTSIQMPRFNITLLFDNDGSLYCLDVNIPIGTEPGVYKVIVEVANGTIIEKTEAKINVVIKPPRIDSADLSRQQLLLTGIGFTAPPTVIINGEDVTKKLRIISGNYLLLQGSRKKLNLHRGVNEVYVNIDGQTSEIFRFNVD